MQQRGPGDSGAAGRGDSRYAQGGCRRAQTGAIVLDTASVKAPVQAWASELLPDTVLFIGTNPVLIVDDAGGAAAHADLFQRATWAICPSPTTGERAVKMAADLAERLGAQPLFLQAIEHDSMLAKVDHLPAVISMALLTAMVSQPSWRESRRLASGQFESSTRLVSADPHVFGDAILANREQVTRWIDTFIDAMASWREAIASGDEEAIGQGFRSAMDERERWLRDRRNGRWAGIEPGHKSGQPNCEDVYGPSGRTRITGEVEEIAIVMLTPASSRAMVNEEPTL